MHSSLAIPSLSRAVLPSLPSNVRSVSWSNRGCSMRDEERIASWTECSGWMPRLWKGPTSRPEPSPQSKGSRIRLRRPDWSWKTRVMSCSLGLRPRGLHNTVDLNSYRRHDRLTEVPVCLLVPQRPRRRRRVLYRAMLKSKRTRKDQCGTVGAVALDRSGTVAAGASTGGIDSMLPGRVGDSPLIGCGVYADNLSGAVSMTGIGEGIVRLVIAKSICDRLGMGKSPAVAARQALRMLVSRIRGSAGALVLSPAGRFAIRHVTPYMAAGWWNGTGQPTVRGQFP